MTPSVVRFLADNQEVAGEPALRKRMEHPESTVAGIKRFIGRAYNEVADLAAMAPFQVVPGYDNSAMVRTQDRERSPVEISAAILRELRRAAEAYLGETVDRAVITVPAYFTEAQRRATGEAARAAGLRVDRLVPEPTAAAMAYGAAWRHDQIVLVLDLGGGTYDVSLLEVGEGIVEVKAIDGDGYLGGDDFDEALLAWASGEILRRHGFDLSSAPAAVQRVREAVVEAKHQLSHGETSRIEVPFLFHRENGPVNVSIPLTRRDFESICDELFERLAPPIERLFAASWVNVRDVDEVLLVGGATRMARVSEIVESYFGKPPSRRVNPEEAVALGAAIQAGVLDGSVKDILLMDVFPFAISIELAGGHAVAMISANTTIPTRKSEIFTTLLDDQASVEVNVLRGDYPIADENRAMGTLTLASIPPAPAGAPQIEVAVDIDANLHVHVTARDLGTGVSERLDLRLS